MEPKNEGLREKYIVRKADTGEEVICCFVLRPDRDVSAIAAIRSYAATTENKALAADLIRWVGEEPNAPLTMEELREMAQRCVGIYVTHADGSPLFRGQTYCAAVLDLRPAFGSPAMHIQAIYGDKLTLWEDEYGKTWFAYRRRPEEEYGKLV